jgi:hypothetical protein
VKRRVFRMVLIGLLAVALMGLGHAATTHPVSAGTNGQQLLLSVSCQYAPSLAEVKVSGHNQRGQTTTWSAQPDSRNVVTDGYWWVGWVYIQYRHPGVNPYTGVAFSWYGTYVYVPANFYRNVYPVAVDWGLDCQPAWQP